MINIRKPKKNNKNENLEIQKKLERDKKGFDYSTKTDHEIHTLVREVLEQLGLRKRLYPAFIKMTNKCENREDLVRLVKTTLEKAKKLTELPDSTKKVTPISTSITTSKTVSKLTTREREGTTTTSTIHQKNDYPKKWLVKNNKIPPLSVWNQIQYFLKHPKEKEEDPAFLKRLENYAKRASIIIHVIDTYQIVNVGEAYRKANEIPGVRIKSQTTIGDLLNDLASDGFLDLEQVETFRKVETSLYSIKGYKEQFPERYNIKMIRHSNGMPKKRLAKKMVSLREKSKNLSLAQKEGYAEARKIENELNKISVTEKTREFQEHKEKEQKQKREQEEKNMLLEITPEQKERSEKAKEVREKIKKPKKTNQVIDIKYTCQSCRIKRYQDKNLEKHKCPECKNEMTPILDGDVRLEGTVTYLKEFDKR